MTADFWVLLAVLVVLFLASFIIGMFLSVPWALISAIPTLIAYAFVLWNQYCLRAGDCYVLAWLNVAFYIFIFLFSVVALSLALYLSKKEGKKKATTIEKEDKKKEGFFFPVGVPHHMML